MMIYDMISAFKVFENRTETTRRDYDNNSLIV